MSEQRQLIKQSNAYAKENRFQTWTLFFITLLILGLCETAIVWVPFWWAKWIPAALAGLTWVRVFIFFHDWLHKTVFIKSPVGNALMTAYGFLTLVPPSVWRQTHDYHHQNNAKMVGASIGSYPTVTVGMWKGMNESQRRWYAIARHPLTIAFAYFTIFLAGMCISSYRRDPQTHQKAPLAIVVHFSAMALLALLFGPVNALFMLFVPVFIACAAGGYLFYAQHNFPDIQLKGRREWDYTFAALNSSSMMKMGPAMNWFTGNIGYHHVHHLNHRIPFYRLPEAMSKMEELQSPGTTTLSLADISACLRLKLWDPDANRLVSWTEAEALIHASATD